MSEETKVEAKAKKAPLKRWKITFHGQGGDVEIGHNGKLNVWQRNVESEIDEHFLGVLKDAVITTFVQDEKGDRKQVTIPTIQYTLGEQVA